MLRKNITFAAVVGMACSFMLTAGQSVYAQDVTIIGPPVTLLVTTTSTDENGEETMRQEEKDAEFIRIFGQTQDSMMLIRTDGGDEYVSKDELLALLPELKLDQFPVVEEINGMSPGTNGEVVLSLQETLDSLGFLDGIVDAVYGMATAAAVSRFQEAHNLEATGTADRYTMMLIQQIADGMEEKIEVSSKPYESPEEKFPKIAGKTEGDLNLFMEPTWRFTFDDLEKCGYIDPAIELGTFEVAEPAIDRISGVLSVKVAVAYNEETNLYDLIPAIVVETSGVYRPYLQGAALIGAEGAVKVEGGVSKGILDGITLQETGYVPLSPETVQQFASGDVQTVRVLGRNTEYDVEVSFKKRKMKAFMEACEGLLDWS